MSKLIFIPQPSQVVQDEGQFLLDSGTRILIAPEASAETVFTGRDLATWIETVTGLTLPIENGAMPDTVATNTISLLLAGGILGGEGYRLTIGEHTIVIEAASEAGLFYGVQTLAQVLKTCGRSLPALSIEDRPALAQRGVMLDVSRARVPRLDALKRVVALLAHYKINQFQLYIEHTYLFSQRRAFGESMGALTGEEMRELDTFCRQRHVELVPNLQSFGHQRHLLNLPEYAHLSETSWKWTLTPAREETYDLLAEMYKEFLPNFSSTQFNVDCDETWDHGLGQSKPLADQLGKGRVYLNHLLRLREMAAQYGKTIQVWADIVLDHPELIPEIPSDVTLLDWRYEDQPSYPTVETLAQTGHKFMVCPGVSTWNTLFPRLDNAIGNILGYTRAGIEHGAVGMLNTDWGDYGHYHQPSHAVYGYVFGAETAWTGAKTEADDFDAKVGPLVFGDWSGRVVAAIRQMGKAVEQPELKRPNRSDAMFALYDDPLAGRMAETAPEVFATLATAAQAGLAAFASLADDQQRQELSFTAYQMAFVADKLANSYALRAGIRNGVNSLAPFVTQLKIQRDRLAAMKTEFERLWLAQSKPSEIHVNLQRYDLALSRYDAAIAWLEAGNRILSTYTPDETPILWEEGFKLLMELVDTVGFENLPPLVQGWLGTARRKT